MTTYLVVPVLGHHVSLQLEAGVRGEPAQVTQDVVFFPTLTFLALLPLFLLFHMFSPRSYFHTVLVFPARPPSVEAMTGGTVAGAKVGLLLGQGKPNKQKLHLGYFNFFYLDVVPHLFGVPAGKAAVSARNVL